MVHVWWTLTRQPLCPRNEGTYLEEIPNAPARGRPYPNTAGPVRSACFHPLAVLNLSGYGKYQLWRETAGGGWHGREIGFRLCEDSGQGRGTFTEADGKTRINDRGLFRFEPAETRTGAERELQMFWMRRAPGSPGRESDSAVVGADPPSPPKEYIVIPLAYAWFCCLLLEPGPDFLEPAPFTRKF